MDGFWARGAGTSSVGSRRDIRIMLLLRRITALLVVLVVIAASCGITAPSELILFDFESDAELDLLRWNCHTLFALSDLHASHGIRSLRMDLFPFEYPGLEFSPQQKDWSKYNTFSFDVYNPSESPVQLSIRIDDRKKPPPFNDRYNNRFVLNHGNNHISIPLNNLITSGTKRRLNLASIYTVYIFATHPASKQTFYIDAIRLTAANL